MKSKPTGGTKKVSLNVKKVSLQVKSKNTAGKKEIYYT